MKGCVVKALLGSVAVGAVLSLGAGPAVAAPAGAAALVARVVAPAQGSSPTTAVSVPLAAPTPTVAGEAPAERVVIGDPEADRTIRRIVWTLLGLAGLVLLVTIVFWRATRPVPVPLRRLSTMGTRSWRKADSVARADMLGPLPASARPAVVEPLRADAVAVGSGPVVFAAEPAVAAASALVEGQNMVVPQVVVEGQGPAVPRAVVDVPGAPEPAPFAPPPPVEVRPAAADEGVAMAEDGAQRAARRCRLVGRRAVRAER